MLEIKSALLIGVDQYEHIGNLKYCDNDARELAKSIPDHNAFGITEQSIAVITSSSLESPTRQFILSALGEKLGSMDTSSGILLYFAGHGIEIDGAPYILPSDFNPEVPRLTSIAVSGLMSEIRSAGVNLRVFIFDSCYSGVHRGERTPDKEAFQVFVSSFGRAFDPAQEGAAVLSSASINETAREQKIEGKGHGIYTYSLLKSFSRLRDVALHGQDIHIEDLHRIAYQETVLASNGKQHPRFFYSAGSPITIYRGTGSKPRPSPLSDEEAEEDQRSLLSGLTSLNPELQKVAAENLIQYGSAVVDPLIERLDHRRADVRNWAAYCLGEIGDPNTILHLLGATRNRPITRRREPFAENAVDALKKFGAKIVPVALDFIDDENLRHEELDRVISAIVPVWDGIGNSQGKKVYMYMNEHQPSLIIECPQAPYVRNQAIRKVKKEISQLEGKSKPKRKIFRGVFRSGTSSFFYPLGYLLRYYPDDVEEIITENDLYKNNLDYLYSVKSACEIAGINPVTDKLQDVVSKKIEKMERGL